MFVGDEVVLSVGIAAARARLATLAQDGLLVSASQDAYSAGVTGLSRVGALGMYRVVQVHICELTERDGSSGLALRWEVTGPGAALFPALDADITMRPAGEETTSLTLAGTYRPPLGALGRTLDRAILHRVAAATVRNFLSQVAAGLTGQPGAAPAVPAPLRSAPEMP